MDPVAEPVIVRQYRNDEADWWTVRELLVRTHDTPGRSWNWDIRRWDGLRFHSEVPALPDDLAATIGMWETADGRLVAVVHPEGGSDPFLELDPGFRHLEPAMLDWAEARLWRVRDGRRVVEVFAWDWDVPRRALLAERGYVEEASGGWVRWIRFGDRPIPAPVLADGYAIRATTAEDARAMAALLNASFNRTVHTGLEYSQFMANAPAFRHDLNLVAVAPGGELAAHAGVYLDEVNRHGIFEPVCTHPDHLRRGLARALMLDGMHRLRALGAVTASVDTGDMEAANALYRAMGFTEEHHGAEWRLDLGPG